MGDLGWASVKLYLQKACSGLVLASGLLIPGLDSLPIIYGSLDKGHTGNDFLRYFVQQQQNFRVGKFPGLGRSPREGNGYPLQYSGLENSIQSMGVTKSQTRLGNFQQTESERSQG